MSTATAASASTTATHATQVSFDVSQLPSLKDGMTLEEEATKRRRTCRFLDEAGRVLKLPRVAVATSMVFFHRFYAKHSFAEHDRFEVAIACILLAAKTEEAPRKLNVVIDECCKLRSRAMASGRVSQQPSPHSTTSSPSLSSPAETSSPLPTTTTLDPKSEEFAKLKERILLLERVILHTIGFELSIDHPYKFFDQITKLIQTRQLEYIHPPSASANLSSSQLMSKMTNEIVQYSMNFANDSMHTPLCLQFSARSIAIACIYLAAQFAKVRPSNGKSWLEVFGNPDVEVLVSICVQIMELISDRKGAHVAKFKEIRAELEKMRDTQPSGVAEANLAKKPRVV